MIAFDQSNNNRELVISIMKLNEVFFIYFIVECLKCLVGSFTIGEVMNYRFSDSFSIGFSYVRDLF